MNRPNFLGIGMQKTGTTWLYRTLREHRDVFLPPKKELRHLMEIAHSLASHEAVEIELFQAQRRNYNARLVRRNLKNLLLGRLRFDDLRWDLGYRAHCSTDPSWYAEQFAFSDAAVRGEISPQYHRLGPEHIAAVRGLLPELRIVLFLRNPVDQIWSQAKMVLARETGRTIDAVPEREIRAFCDHWRSINFDYLDIISNWVNAFGRENLLVNFFEDLESDSYRVYREVCAFLEIDPARGPGDGRAIRTPVNRGVESQASLDVQQHIYDQWQDSVGNLSRQYPQAEPWTNRPGGKDLTNAE